MSRKKYTPSIFIAEDDDMDRKVIKEAFEKCCIANRLDFSADGSVLMDKLHDNLKTDKSRLPNLIMLDMKMPRKNGMETLSEIRGHPELQHIPVIILTSSDNEEEIFKTYQLGVNSFITKRPLFSDLMVVIEQIINYWFKTVELPLIKHKA